jgi:hypothetical protein
VDSRADGFRRTVAFFVHGSMASWRQFAPLMEALRDVRARATRPRSRACTCRCTRAGWWTALACVVLARMATRLRAIARAWAGAWHACMRRLSVVARERRA